MDPWYKVASPRKEVREGRSFNPDEFAIALEQVVAGTAPKDYSDPCEFFRRTCFTRALRDHTGMALRRLSGQTGNTAPVMALMTQFGGGKTHTLATLFHAAGGKITLDQLRAITRAGQDETLLSGAGWLDEFRTLPHARTAIFVGNAWDPQDGRENPWIDIARQLADEKGVKLLGKDAQTTPPGTEALGNIFKAANAPVLVLMDEVLNFLNRHRRFADSFHAFIQNLTVAMTGTTHGVAMISLPRSQVEMSDWDQQWQAKITKVVKRVAKDLIVNDEGEIAEVVRRRLFDDMDSPRVQKEAQAVAKAYATWCFEKRAQLPPEWTAGEAAGTEAKAKDFLRRRFAACYPFHPATLSVFQRKWRSLTQSYQQTRGTLAMLAQWVSWAFVQDHQKGIAEPMLTLGRAPLHVPGFQAVVLGQLGEARLNAAIEYDIAGDHSHARALDADTKGPLREIHRRVGAAILFESSGGMTDKNAHLPELRFALGEPGLDTTSIDNAAIALEKRGYYIRKAGTDGFRFGFLPTLKRVVADRKASLDEEEDIFKPMRVIVRKEFEHKADTALHLFPLDGSEVADSPRLTVVVLDPATEWDDRGELRTKLGQWTKVRGQSQRAYPGALVWCVRKPGRDLHDKLEQWKAWEKVKQEIDDRTLPAEFERGEYAKVAGEVTEGKDNTVDEVWASYRFILVADPSEPGGLKLIDLGAGHASAGQSLTQRIIVALTSEGLLNESVGAGYLERNWPPALKESGAWPLSGMRQAFLNGALTRLADPDRILRAKIAEFVQKGDFGLGSNQGPDGRYERMWFQQTVGAEDITFDAQVFLLTRQKAKSLLKSEPQPRGEGPPAGLEKGTPEPRIDVAPQPLPQWERGGKEPGPTTVIVRVCGAITPEVWNKLGVRLLPRMRAGLNLRLGVDFSCELPAADAEFAEAELIQAIRDLRLADALHVTIADAASHTAES